MISVRLPYASNVQDFLGLVAGARSDDRGRIPPWSTWLEERRSPEEILRDRPKAIFLNIVNNTFQDITHLADSHGASGYSARALIQDVSLASGSSYP